MSLSRSDGSIVEAKTDMLIIVDPFHGDWPYWETSQPAPSEILNEPKKSH